MKTSTAWVGALLALVTSAPFDDTQAAASAAEARRRVQTAMEELTRAVKRIEKDPPSPEDLSAAERAVEALKRAVDEGASHEAQDLEYAKTALAARKELRTRREYVERRVSQGHIHERRRSIDRSAADLESSIGALRPAGIGSREFDRAHRAAATLEAELSKAQALASQDDKFASHLTETRTRLERAKREIEARQTQVEVERRTALLEAAKKKLEAALTPLSGKDLTDAQFDAADRATTELEKTLEAGRVLEAKDKSYRAQAAALTESARRARKTIEERWGETGLLRLRAEIGPAHEDLTRSSRALGGRSPSAEVVAEARTAAIVVQKLLEKSEHLAKRGRSVAEYLDQVKKTLLLVQVELQRRKLEPARSAVSEALKRIAGSAVEEKEFLEADQTVHRAREILREGEGLEKDDRGYASYAREVRRSFDEASLRIVARRSEAERGRQKATVEKARADLSRALMPIERRAPSQAQFDEANTAAIVLEKTIEASAGIKDRDFQSYLSQMRSVLQAARRTLDTRRLAVEVERQQARVEEGRRELDRAMKQIFGRSTPEERLSAVDEAIEKTRKILDEGKALVGRDYKYAAYDREVRKRLQETATRLATRREELAVQAQQARVSAGLKTLEKSLAALDGFGPKAPALAAVDDALNAAKMDIEAGVELEKKVSVYRNWVKPARKALELSRLRLAKKKLQFTVADAKSELEAAVLAARSALEAAGQPSAGAAALESAKSRVKEFAALLERHGPLEAEDSSHAKLAAKLRAQLAELEQGLGLAGLAATFQKTVVTALESGTLAAQNGADSKNLQLSRDEYKKAVDELQACRNRGEEQLEAEPRLAGFIVLAERARVAAKEVVAWCKERHEAAADGLRKVSGVLAFHEGPAKAYEAAGAHLAKAQGASGEARSRHLAEALGQFEECISSGKILQYKNPELQDRGFEVQGRKFTLAQLVATCTDEAKKLRAK